MTSSEFSQELALDPTTLAGEVAAMIDIEDGPNRYKALPRDIAPDATDYLNGVETVDVVDTRSLFDNHAARLAQARTEVAAAFAEVEEDVEPENAAMQKRLEDHVRAARTSKDIRVVRAAKPSDAFSTTAVVNSKYL